MTIPSTPAAPTDSHEGPAAPHAALVSRQGSIETLFALVIASVPIVALVSPNALVPLLMGTVLAVLVAILRGQAGWRPKPGRLAVALGLLTAVGALSAAWSIVPSASIHKALQLIPLFAASYLLVAAAGSLSPQSRQRIGRWLTTGVVIAIVIIFVEALAGGLLNHFLAGQPLYGSDAMLRYKRGLVVLALFSGPASYWVSHRFGWAAVAALNIAVIVCAILVQSGAVLAAVLTGVVLALFTARFPSWGSRGLALALVLGVLAAPLVRFAPSEMPPDALREIQAHGLHRLNSAVHRLLIWQFVGEKIAERPVLGWGLDSSRAIPGGQLEVQGFSERLPLHPHNAALQLWLELGLLGGVLGAFIAAWPVLSIDRRIAPGSARAAAIGLAAATAAIAFLGFGIWQSWWVAALGLVSICAVAVLPSRLAT